jgi:hypothetical protein
LDRFAYMVAEINRRDAQAQRAAAEMARNDAQAQRDRAERTLTLATGTMSASAAAFDKSSHRRGPFLRRCWCPHVRYLRICSRAPLRARSSLFGRKNFLNTHLVDQVPSTQIG